MQGVNCMGWLVRGVTFVVMLVFVGTTEAGFVLQSTQSIPSTGTGIHGIGSDGSSFYIGMFSNGIRVADATFSETGTIDLGVFQEIRGVAYDRLNDDIIATDYNTGTLYRLDGAGTILDSFSVGVAGQINAVGVDRGSGDIFVAEFGGFVLRYNSKGVFQSQFDTGITLTGLAVDSVNQSLMLLTSEPDSVIEFDYSGSPLVSPFPGDAVSGNGQGLFYDETNGDLYVTSQNGNVYIYNDPQRTTLPEPAGVLLVSLGLLGIVGCRRKPS